MVHAVQVEEGLQPFRRLGQAAAPFVRPRAETTVAEPTPEFANATFKLLANCQQHNCQFPRSNGRDRVAASVSRQLVTESNYEKKTTYIYIYIYTNEKSFVVVVVVVVVVNNCLDDDSLPHGDARRATGLSRVILVQPSSTVSQRNEFDSIYICILKQIFERKKGGKEGSKERWEQSLCGLCRCVQRGTSPSSWSPFLVPLRAKPVVLFSPLKSLLSFSFPQLL